MDGWAPLLPAGSTWAHLPCKHRQWRACHPRKSSKKPSGTMAASQTQSEAPRRELPRLHHAPLVPSTEGTGKAETTNFHNDTQLVPSAPLRQVPLAFWVAATSPSAPQDVAQPGRWSGPFLQPRDIRPSLGTGQGGPSCLLPGWSLLSARWMAALRPFTGVSPGSLLLRFENKSKNEGSRQVGTLSS